MFKDLKTEFSDCFCYTVFQLSQPNLYFIYMGKKKTSEVFPAPCELFFFPQTDAVC